MTTALRALALAVAVSLSPVPSAGQSEPGVPEPVRVEVNDSVRMVNRVLRYWRWRGHSVRAVLDRQEPRCAPPSDAERNVIRLCRRQLPGAIFGLYDFVLRVAYVEKRWWDEGWVICHELGHGLGYTHGDRAIWRCPRS